MNTQFISHKRTAVSMIKKILDQFRVSFFQTEHQKPAAYRDHSTEKPTKTSPSPDQRKWLRPPKPSSVWYKALLKQVNLKNKQILEVGSGDGAEAAHITSRYSPLNYIGLESSEKHLSFCQKNYRTPGLSFRKGKAENLPFPPVHFDVVLKVQPENPDSKRESSFREIHRVLKQDGYFLLNDSVDEGKADEICYLLIDNGFEIVSVRNITAEVVSERNDLSQTPEKNRVETLFDRWLFSNPDSKSIMHLEKLGTEKEYWSFVLKKH